MSKPHMLVSAAPRAAPVPLPCRSACCSRAAPVLLPCCFYADLLLHADHSHIDTQVTSRHMSATLAQYTREGVGDRALHEGCVEEAARH